MIRLTACLPLLRVENLKTCLSQPGGAHKTVVNGVSFTIHRGEIFCLVGESGSGKSMTALSLMRLLPKNAHHPEGQVWFHWREQQDSLPQWRDVLPLPESHCQKLRGERMAMIFQDPGSALNPTHTIGEQLLEALLLHKPELTHEEAIARIISLLHRVKIEDPEHCLFDYPHRFSGGQQQRIMIAMAMLCSPDLLIADEPTTALDVTVQAEILKIMQTLRQQSGMSILFITHNLSVVWQLADRIAVMYQGKIVEEGHREAIFEHPQHPYTQKLLEALPEKLIPGRTRKESVSGKKAALLQIEGLKVYFPKLRGIWRRTVDYVKAVDDVSLTMQTGEILAVVGESGSGKSTLGRAIARLVTTYAGTIHFSGYALTSLSTSQTRKLVRRNLQIIFQDPMTALNPRLPVSQTLIEPMQVHGIGQNQEAWWGYAREILRRVHLPEEYLDRYPHELSGGERQRIAIARALVLQPQLIICDEITSALDVSTQAEILKLLIELCQQWGMALLFISHDISVVEYLSDTLAVMYQGKIVDYGKTADLCHPSASLSAYTRRLLDSVPKVGREITS